MRLLLTADLHRTDNPRDRYRAEWQTELRQLAKEYYLNAVLILGDLCEEKDRHSAVLVNEVVDDLHKLAQIRPVKIVMGNHDYSNPDNPFWGFLSHIENIEFISFPGIYSELGDALILPHTRNWEKDWKNINLKKHSLVFCHNTFEGADAGHGTRLKGIPTNIFAPDAQVFAGDIHIPQTLGPVTYIGAPYTINFGDRYEPRVILLENSKVKSIPCQGPQKMVVYFEWRGGQLQTVSKGDIVQGDIVQVRVHLSRADYADWAQITNQVKKWGEQEQVLVYQVKPETQSQLATTEATRSAIRDRSRDDLETYKEYVKRMKIDDVTAKVGEGLL